MKVFTVLLFFALLLSTDNSRFTASAATNCLSYLLPTTSPSPSPVLSVNAINGILHAHNGARRTVSPAAAAMPMLTWNQTLANYAQEYMDGCPGMVHSASSLRQNPTRFGYAYLGENLAAGMSPQYGAEEGGAKSTDSWNSEVADWTYPMACRAGAACGHYTQNIWAATLEVGCGYKYCASLPYKNYWSCVYGPGGNYVGQNPYVQASASATAECQMPAGQTPAPIVTGNPAVAGVPATLGPTASAQGKHCWWVMLALAILSLM